MMIVQRPQAIYRPVMPLLPRAEPRPEPAVIETVDSSAKSGSRGIGLLSGDAAAVVLAEQGQPAALPGQTPAPAPVRTPAGSDLRGRDLRETDLTGLDLRGADLTGADLRGKNLGGMDLSGATLTDARFDAANLTGANLDGTIARGASFTGATLAHTQLNEADFSGAKFDKASFGPARTSADTGYYDISSTKFDDADFSNSDLKAIAYIGNSSFDRAVFNGADFGALTPRGIPFSGGSLRGASFQQMKGAVSIASADASGADFTRIDGARINIQGSLTDKLSFAGSSVELWMSDVDARDMNLLTKDRNLREADFTNVIMTGMDFSGYDLSGSKLRTTTDGFMNSFIPKGSSLLKAALSGTNLAGANLDQAFIQNIDLRNTALDGASLNGTEAQVGNAWEVDTIANYRQLGILPSWWDDVPKRLPQPDEAPGAAVAETGDAATKKQAGFDLRQALVDVGMLDSGPIDVAGDSDTAVLKLFDTDVDENAGDLRMATMQKDDTRVSFPTFGIDRNKESDGRLMATMPIPDSNIRVRP